MTLSPKPRIGGFESPDRIYFNFLLFVYTLGFHYYVKVILFSEKYDSFSEHLSRFLSSFGKSYLFFNFVFRKMWISTLVMTFQVIFLFWSFTVSIMQRFKFCMILHGFAYFYLFFIQFCTFYIFLHAITYFCIF